MHVYSIYRTQQCSFCRNIRINKIISNFQNIIFVLDVIVILKYVKMYSLPRKPTKHDIIEAFISWECTNAKMYGLL